MRRRGYLALVTAGGLAGCLGGGDDNDDRENNGSDDDGGDSEQGLLTQQWQTSLDTNAVDATRYSATTADGAVFVGSQGGVTALELADGTERWHRDEFQSFTAVHADAQGVVALTREKQLVALDTASGSTRWTTSVKGAAPEALSPSGLTDTAVLVSTSAGTTLYDRTSGEIVAQVGDSEHGIVADDEVAVLVSAFEMIRVEPDSGAELWRTDVEATRGGAVGDGTVVVTNPAPFGDEDSVVAVDTGSGDILWEVSVEPLGGGFPQVDIGGGVATLRASRPSDTGTLYALALNDGSATFTAGVSNPPASSGPLAVSDLVVVETESEFVAFDPTTGERRASTDAPFLTLSLVAEDNRFLTCARDVTAYQL